MRSFRDGHGTSWVATVRARPGRDYKGRFYFFVRPESGGDEEGIALLDVRWNSERTAQRTLATMSEVELKRRLAWARGRGGLAVDTAAAAL